MPRKKVTVRKDGRIKIQKTYPGYGIKWFYGKTLSECQRKKQAWEKLMLTPANSITPAVTFGEYTKIWKAAKKSSVAEDTFETYENYIKNHLSVFSDAPLSSITATQVMAQLQKERDAGKSTRTIEHIFVLIKAILNSAVIDELIPRNPLFGIKKPKAYRSRPITVLSKKQVKDFLSCITDDVHRAILELATVSGMRRSEVLALTWDNVNFENSLITVSWTAIKVKGRIKINPITKTSSSYRTIAIAPDTMARLKRIRQIDEAKREAGALRYANNNLVFPGRFGAPMYPDYVTKLAAKYGKLSGMPDGFTLHGLRHTHATILLADGKNYKVVQHRLGHSTAQQTLDTYSHVTPDMDQGASRAFDNLIK